MIKVHIEGDHNDPIMVSILALLAGTGSPVTLGAAAGEEDDDTVQAPATPADPNERDTTGLPWSEEIHSKARSKNADGTWRKRKGVNPDLVTAVEGRLRSQNAAAAPATPAPVIAPPVAAPAPVVTAPPIAAAPVVAPQPAPVTAPPVAAPTPAPVAASGAPADFAGFMEVVSKSMGAGLVNADFLAWLCGQPDVAVGQITEIAAAPAKITAAYNHLVAQNRIAP